MSSMPKSVIRAFQFRYAVLFTFFAACLGAAAPAHATVDEAKSFVEGLANQTLEILQDKDAAPKARREKFATLFKSGADLDRIGRFVLGRYAKQMKAENRLQEYQALFREYVVNIYAKRLGQYSGETFDITGANAVNDKEVLVNSNIQSDSSKFRVDWQVRNSGQGYKIVDVRIEGISMALEQREQFVSFINNNGKEVSALIDFLKGELQQPA